jgi:hypothetical protein
MNAWKQHDRPCEPCRFCGAELYDKFWGNGGWVPTEKATDNAHGNCIRFVKGRLDAARAALLVVHDIASARLRNQVTDANAKHDLAEIERIAAPFVTPSEAVGKTVGEGSEGR